MMRDMTYAKPSILVHEFKGNVYTFDTYSHFIVLYTKEAQVLFYHKQNWSFLINIDIQPVT